MECSGLSELVLQRFGNVGSRAENETGEKFADECIGGDALAKSGFHPTPAAGGEAGNGKTRCRVDADVGRRGNDQLAGHALQAHVEGRVELAGISRSQNATKTARRRDAVIPSRNLALGDDKDAASGPDRAALPFEFFDLEEKSRLAAFAGVRVPDGMTPHGGDEIFPAHPIGESLCRGFAGLPDVKRGEGANRGEIDPGFLASKNPNGQSECDAANECRGCRGRPCREKNTDERAGQQAREGKPLVPERSAIRHARGAARVGLVERKRAVERLFVTGVVEPIDGRFVVGEGLLVLVAGGICFLARRLIGGAGWARRGGAEGEVL